MIKRAKSSKESMTDVAVSSAKAQITAAATISRNAVVKGRWPRTSMGMLIWLTLVWVLLWGEPTLANTITGLALALLVTTLLPIPRTPFDVRFRPLALVILIVKFLWDVTVASTQIAWFAIIGRKPHGAVIRVRLRSHSDTYLTMCAGMTSLVPGSVVIDAHRHSGTLYIHVFDVKMSGGLAGAHRSALRQEERILRAFGSAEQLIDAGFVPGSTYSAGRLPRPFAPATGDPQ